MKSSPVTTGQLHDLSITIPLIGQECPNCGCVFAVSTQLMTMAVTSPKFKYRCPRGCTIWYAKPRGSQSPQQAKKLAKSERQLHREIIQAKHNAEQAEARLRDQEKS